MFKKFTNGCVRVVNRWLPDPFLFAIILTIVVFIAAMAGTQQGPLELIWAWGGKGATKDGFWSLLAFAMQMALVLVLGSAMASAKVCKRALGAIASLAHNKRSAILITTFVSTICCWLNWGFGLIAGALLAREVAKRVKDVDYPLLIAAAYSGFVIWHAGLSGSIPLQIGAEAGTEILGVSYYAPTSATIFHPMNLLMVGVILVLMPFVNYAMHPDKDHFAIADVLDFCTAGSADDDSYDLTRELILKFIAENVRQAANPEEFAKSWDEAVRIFNETSGLNLDKKQALMNIIVNLLERIKDLLSSSFPFTI